MKYSILYLFIFLNLTEIIISEINQEIQLLNNIIQCIEEKNQINKNTTTNLKNLLYNYNPYNIQKVYEFMQENIHLVNQCTNDLSDIPESLLMNFYPINRLLKRYSWGLYLKCIENHEKRDDSLRGIIDYIHEKNYYSASMEELRLLNEGNIVILLCLGKKNEEMNLSDVLVSAPKLNFS